MGDDIGKIVIPPSCECPDPETWIKVYEYRRNKLIYEQWANVGKEAQQKVNSLGLIIECEILRTGEVALYCRLPYEENYGCELAENGPGEKSPTNVLTRMILEKAKRLIGEVKCQL